MKNILQLILLLFPLVTLIAESGPTIKVSRVSDSFSFDGKIEEGEWSDIKPMDLIMQIPVFGGQPTERTEIRLAYDDDYLYLSGVLLDSDATKIMANSKKRDALTGSTDWFGFVVDSYNDKESALAFFTTPTGLRLDAEVANDAVGGNAVNVSWNNFWDVKTTRDDKGWYVEIRVPFSSLPFQIIDDKVIMGITSWRYVARKSEVVMYPGIRPDYGDWSSWKPSLAQEYEFEGIKQEKPFYITPYVLGGHSSVNELNDEETAYISEKKYLREGGLDIKYGITNNWTLDLSVNTDFAQVEADDQQINLTRFSLFFPEKRLFFQERSGVFNFNFGRRDKLFYSRRIGIDEDGNPISILGGARVVGRAGKWDMGLINMQTGKTDDLATENFGVIRLKRQIVNENSNLGAIFTNRVDADGNYNSVYGVDASVRVTGENYLQVRVAQSFSDSLTNDVFSLDPAKLWLSYVNQSRNGFSQGSSISYSGKDFDPGMGFDVRSDYFRIGNRTSYSWYASPESKIFKHSVSSFSAAHWANENNKLESLRWFLEYSVNAKSGWGAELQFGTSYERLDEVFELSDDAEVPIGTYTFRSVEIEASSSFQKPFVLAGSVEYGSFYDGTKKTVSLIPTFNASSSLELSGYYEYNDISFDERGQSFTAHVARLKALYMFSTKLSISSFVQYNSTISSYLGNIRLRYNPKEGNDLYIVYNGDFNTDRERESPVIPNHYGRVLQVKYSYTFSL